MKQDITFNLQFLENPAILVAMTTYLSPFLSDASLDVLCVPFLSRCKNKIKPNKVWYHEIYESRGTANSTIEPKALDSEKNSRENFSS